MSENWGVLSFWLKLSVFGVLLIAISAARVLARILKILPSLILPRTQL
ncbi:hypothetical protein [Methylocapsa palsarum]|uniref:Uncharacterized protein n=1 Tax=Methylocapsa palsarum TaxID=1612308 RepID=A0A1I4AKI9_9HYPH|nr:hypothetical protein [Methylocapsa palsarum]SFK56259.1 hypothetical protein SAMN05444581_110129 [Methylocapsa palsarum]